MDFTVQLPSDPLERRRQQNRIAQRKFRQKKQLAGTNPRARPFPQITPTSDLLSLSTDVPGLTLGNTAPTDGPPAPDVIDSLLFGSTSSNPFSASLFPPSPYPTPPSASEGTATTATSHLSRDSVTRDSRLASRHPDEAIPTPKKDKDKSWLGTVHIAAQNGHERILRVLLQQRGSGNVDVDVNAPDSEGRTPLCHAVVEDHEPVVRLLLSHGARIGVLDCEGRSALHWAVLYRRLEVLRLLLDHWAAYERDWFDLDAYDRVGWTPLHLAVERGFEPGVLLLLERGADINAKAKRCPTTGGIIPFSVAPMRSSR
ncbi:ankyrin repeat-containing domain protein [Aspergillus lucknowensis]|uniref:Ankyrin repeat-containing domain protein n=1 Tax=Aspergillus lucknowensis TaxID=176173 RepID=A0ABR4LHD0_9EURO